MRTSTSAVGQLVGHRALCRGGSYRPSGPRQGRDASTIRFNLVDILAFLLSNVLGTLYV